MTQEGTVQCHVNRIEKSVDPVALAASTAVVLDIDGMGCPACAARVRNGLLEQTGVLQAEVTLESRIATIAIDPSQISIDDLVSAVVRAGVESAHRYHAAVRDG